jgi:hypothetical protein
MLESTLDVAVNWVVNHIGNLKVVIYVLLFIMSEVNASNLTSILSTLKYIGFFLVLAYVFLIIDNFIYEIQWPCYSLLMVIICSQVANGVCRYYMTGGLNLWRYLDHNQWNYPTNIRKIDIFVIVLLIAYTWALALHLRD